MTIQEIINQLDSKCSRVYQNDIEDKTLLYLLKANKDYINGDFNNLRSFTEIFNTKNKVCPNVYTDAAIYWAIQNSLLIKKVFDVKYKYFKVNFFYNRHYKFSKTISLPGTVIIYDINSLIDYLLNKGKINDKDVNQIHSYEELTKEQFQSKTTKA